MQRLGEPIAIVGVGCRFPGGANSPEEFWRLLCESYEGVVDVPASRWNADAFGATDSREPGKTVSRRAGIVEQPIEDFDAAFFGMSAREAAQLDPMHRWLLEVTWEAFEDAGIDTRTLAGSPTGVFVGAFTEDAKLLRLSPDCAHVIGPHTATGTSMTMASNRLSYWFDLRGPSVSIDTACSSSLVAVHLACQSLWTGESTLALAGGANAIFVPANTIAESRAGMLSPDGACKTFDASANGYVRGEGAAVVVLKTLSRAVADGDDIYAVILGTASNQDGRTPGITVPNGEAQKAAVLEACRRAGVSPTDINYLEAHGTGTPVGDPIEARALGETCGVGRSDESRCVIGSVKTNIGHLEAAAGVAGLIKAALCLKHGKIPPHRNLRTLNPNIPFETLGLRVPTSTEDWPTTSRKLAGVNSFGFGGSNAHAVLGEAPASSDISAPNATSDARPERAQLVTVSARTPEALQATVASFKNDIAWDTAAPSLANLARTTGARRTHHEERIGFVAGSVQELKSQLESFASGELPPGAVRGAALAPSPRVAWVFSGMGPQWWGMGRELLRTEPVFRAQVEEIDALFRAHAGWSLVEQFQSDEQASRMAETQVSQPANFALQVGLAALLKSWGYAPAAVVGHSAGEAAAAYVAGAMSLAEATRLIYHRSRLQHRTTGQGKLLAVELTRAEAEALIAGLDDVSVAALNSPTAATLVGSATTLERIARELESKSIFNRFLKVDVPFHSHYMLPLRAELEQSLADLALAQAQIPLYSTVTGGRARGTELDAQYWWRNVREPVFFAAAVEAMLRDAICDVFVEIAPHPVLGNSIAQCAEAQRSAVVSIPTLNRKRPERQSLLEAVAHLYVRGVEPTWPALTGPAEFVRLPHYAWQRRRYWDESELSRHYRLAPIRHPLLGRRAISPQPVWQTYLTASAPAFLKDHRVQQAVVFPGAGYVECALAAATELASATQGSDVRVELENVVFENAAFIDEEDAYALQTSVDARSMRVRIDGRREPRDDEQANDERAEHGSWIRHAHCDIRFDVAARPRHARRLEPQAAPEARPLDVRECYERLAKQGLHYGPAFQGIVAIERTHDGVRARIRASEALGDLRSYHLHPALLDACFQALLLAAADSIDTTYLPVAIRRVTLLKRPGAELTVIARTTRADDAALEGDLEIYDADGSLCVVVEAVRAIAIERGSSASASLVRAFSRLVWQPASPIEPNATPPMGACCIFADESGLGRELATRFEAQGRRVVTVRRGTEYANDGHSAVVHPSRRDHFQRLFRELGASPESPLQTAVYLWGLDAVPNDAITQQSLNESLEASGVGLIGLAQELSALSTEPRLWIVTRDAQSVSVERDTPALAQAPLWGLAGTLFFQERRELAGGIVDLPREPSADDAATLMALFQGAPTTETHFALRDGNVLVPRVIAAPEQATGWLAPRMRADRTYLITGGLGGLGLLCARWLVEHGARRIILLARSSLPDRSQWADLSPTTDAGRRALAVTELEALGASVHLMSVDVADEAALSKAVRAFRAQRYPAIAGVFHCAGVAVPTLLDQMQPSQLASESRAKISGAWALHCALSDEPLDFFVSFSSVASLGMSMGMSCYAAGNAFLDALAYVQRRAGITAMSIDWGPWADVGMAGADEIADKFRVRGFEMMAPELGMQALDRLFEHKPIQPIVMVDFWDAVIRNNFPGDAPPLFLQRVQAADDTASADTGRDDNVSIIERLGAIVDPSERLAVMESALRAHVGRVLRMDPDTLDPERPLNQVGLDSLMAVELRNRIERTLGVRPTVMELLQGASVRALSQTILGRLPSAETSSGDAQLLAALAAMPSAQVEALLAQATESTTEVRS